MSAETGQHPVPALSEMSLNETTAANSEADGQQSAKPAEQIVNPFEVIAADERGVDYDKLIETFGTRKIDQAILDRFEKLTGRKPHRYLRRGLFFSQRCTSPPDHNLTRRDLGGILDRYEKGKPFFLYTGRGPSSDSMHIGHVIPFTFTKFPHLLIPLMVGGYKTCSTFRL